MKTNNVTGVSARPNCCLANERAARIRTAVAAFCLLLTAAFPLQAQTPAVPPDISPDQNTDVSTTISTAGSYDAYTGAVRRRVIDLVVPGSVGSEPLKVARIYNSMPWGAWGIDTGTGGSITGRPEYQGRVVSFPDGRRINFLPPKASQTGETAWRGPLGTNERLFVNQVSPYGGTMDLWMEDGSHKLFDWRVELSANDQYLIDIFIPLYFEDPYGQRTTFTHEQIPGTYDPEDIRIKEIRDASGRTLTFSYNGKDVSQITASNGQWVAYTWQPFNSPTGKQISRVDYSDGTFATYTYQNIPIVQFDGTTAMVPRLSTAQDTRAVGPMRAIQYEYTTTPQKDFPGEIKAERHFGDGSLVSAFAHNSGRTSSTDTRGDGPWRTINMQKVDNVPLVTSKSDFKNRFEYFYYDANSYVRQVTDRRNYPTTYLNEPILGKPTRITHPDQSYRAYTYSSNFKPYFVSSVRDENGSYTYYFRDGNNRVYQINFPNGAVETFAFNGFGQVTTHRRTNGVYDAYDHFAYDTTGRLTKRWDPTPLPDYPPASNVPFTSYSYYTSADVWEWADRVRSVTDQMGHVTLYEYDRGANGWQCAGRGLVTKISYPGDTHDGTLPNGTSQSFAYDIYGNRTSVTDELGHTTRYEYDDYNRVTKVTNHLNEFTVTNYALDWVNPYLHTSRSLKYVNSPMNKNVVYDYDANFRRIDQVAALGTPDEAWTLFEYDDAGNLKKSTDPRWKVTTYGYDNRNRQTSVKNEELNETTIFGYDDVGNKIRETRPDTSFKTWDYDTMNRLWHVYDWRYSDPPAANQTTTYDRDRAGNVRTITDTKGAVYSYNYDLKNLKISETYPVDATGASRTYAYHYDDAGNLDYYKNPGGQYKHVTFDTRDRATHSWWDGSAGPDIVTNYDAAGRRTSVVTNNGQTTVAFGYDDANRQVWEDQTLAGYSTRRVQTPRDADGNRTDLEVPGIYLVHYDYTKRNQLWHIYQASGGVFFSYTYDAAGNMTKRKDEWGGVNDSTNAQYDALNRATMWEQTGAGDGWFARSWYQYDNVGREVATWRDEEGSKGERFSYNPTNQLTSAKYKATQVWTGNPLNPARTTTYNYTLDNLNRQSVTDNGVVSNYTFDDLNQYTNVGGQALGYDGNFNLQSMFGFGGTYNSINQLISANSGASAAQFTHAGVDRGSLNTAQFTYDGLGRCVKRTINGSTSVFVLDAWKPILECDGAGNPQVWNIYGAGPDEILLGVTNTSLVRYHLDRMGNVAFLLDANGSGLEKYTYDVFGKPTITDWAGNVRAQSAYAIRFMFTGREWIKELGIYDYRNRFYHPGLGRFLQADPKGFEAGDMNLFRYVGDDPVDKVDPMGLAAVPPLGNYTDPHFLPDYYSERKVVQTWSSVETKTGSIIPTRISWEVTRQDFKVSEITAPTRDKKGNITGREVKPKAAGFTESRISATQGKSIHEFNVRWDFDLQFRTTVGSRWLEFTRKTEPQHINEMMEWVRGSDQITNSVISAAKNGLPALQSRVETMRSNLTAKGETLDMITNRHVLMENGRVVDLSQ